MSEPMLELESAVLKVADVEKTADYYREVLGFSIDWMFGDPPTQAGCASQLIFSRTHSVLCFRVNDLDALFENYRSSGAKILATPALNVDSGQREMDVEDCNGHVLRFVEKVDAEEEAELTERAILEDSGAECPCEDEPESETAGDKRA